MSKQIHPKHSYAVITGASSGIGAEFARQLADEGYPLILTARREDRLMQLADDIHAVHPETNIQIITADLSRTEEMTRLIHLLQREPIGVFINNAGFGDCGHFLETDVEKELTMIDVNVKAVHLLTKQMLQRFEAQNGGYLLNVASSAGLCPAGPYMAAYYASKAYVASLTRAAARELKESGSRTYLGVLCPGPVDTEFNDVANVTFALPGISAANCVREAIRGMKQRRTVIVPTVTMKAAMTLGRYLPQSVMIALTGHQQKKKLGQCDEGLL